MRFRSSSILVLLLVTAILVLCHTCAARDAGVEDTDGHRSHITTFTFCLESDSYTSAGVYSPTGTLLKTLWSRVRYLAGSHEATWDETDDNNHRVEAGKYQIKVLSHNVTYAWDGVIGNTSASFTGTIHNSANGDNVFDLAYDGKKYVYEAFGYNEGRYDIRRFDIENPQTPQDVIHDKNFTAFGLVATDGATIYTANIGSGHDISHTTFVTAYKCSDFSASIFAYGADAILASVDQSEQRYANCIDVFSNGARSTTWPAATGLAVQRNGNLLAVAHGDFIAAGALGGPGKDKVFLYDKHSGDLLGSINVINPQRITFAPNGDLWIVAGTAFIRRPAALVKVPAAGLLVGKARTMVVGLSKPLAIAITPNGNEVLVADGAPSEQVKAFNASTGKAEWVYGELGGYNATNGSLVTNDKFRFGDEVGLATVGDASFWVGDGGCAHGGTNRILHISARHTYLDQIAYLSSNYTVAVNYSNPRRVFWDFLEFNLDYAKPLLPGNHSNGSWKLVRNWAAGMDLTKYSAPHTVVSLKDGGNRSGVYGLLNDRRTQKNALFELAADGTLRPTGQEYYNNYRSADKAYPAYTYSLFGDGELRSSYIDTHLDQSFYTQNITGFDSHNNPQWSRPHLLARVASTTTDPLISNGFPGPSGWQLPVTASGDVVVYDQSNLATGWHLGGIAVGTDHFRWKASPSVKHDVPMDGSGSFDIGDGVTYPGNKLVAQGHDLIYGYHGEFWNATEASQHMHFHDDGLFIGQFGTTGDIVTPLGTAVPGFAGNDFCPAVAQADGETYYFTNDESNHAGIHRWHIIGLNSVREATANVLLGGKATLQMEASAVPSDLHAVASSNSISLRWHPVTGAVSYNIKWAFGNAGTGNLVWPTGKGGPYTHVISHVTSSGCTIPDLTNGTRYYFVVTAVNDRGAESLPSSEAHATPLDVTCPVHLLGQLTTWDHAGLGTPPNSEILALTSNAPVDGRFAVQLHPKADTLGTLFSIDFGSRGYSIFNFNATHKTRSQLLSGYTITPNAGWQDVDQYLSGGFIIDGVAALNSQSGIQPPTGAGSTVSITVPDDTWRCLTVFCPVMFQHPRYFSITLTSTSATDKPSSSTFTVDQTSGYKTGYNHIVQFAFKGNVELATSLLPGTPAENGGACLSAVFLDDYPAK